MCIRDRGSGEEPSAFPVGSELEDFAKLLLEAHAQHFVCFIENKVLHRREVESLPLDEVEEAAGGGYYDLCGATEGGDLAIDGVATTEDFGEDLGGVFSEAKELLANLLGQFTGRSDHEPLDLFLLGIHFREERESKGGCFPCSGLSLRDEVAAILLEVGDGVALNFGRLFDSKLFETLDEVFGDTECEKGIGHNRKQAIRNFWRKSEIFSGIESVEDLFIANHCR